MAIQDDSLVINSTQPTDVSGTSAPPITPIVLGEQAPSIGTAVVSGIVTQSDGSTPIVGATVSAFDATGASAGSDITDASGNYTIKNLAAGDYTLASSADGYIISDSQSVTVADAATVSGTNFSLNTNPNSGLNNIAGMVDDGTMPVAGALVTLSFAGAVVARTITGSDGSWLFTALADGDYIVATDIRGYVNATSSSITVAGGGATDAVTLTVSVDAAHNLATLSGIIQDSTSAPIDGAIVALFLINADTSETLLKVKTTNSSGRFLFGGLTAGKYVIKAKQ